MIIRVPAQPRCATPVIDIGEIVAKRYEIVGLIGSGGFGAVYIGYDLSTGHRVAVKVIKRKYKVSRYHREVETTNMLRDLNSSCFPRFWSTGLEERYHYIAMEELGKDLHKLRTEQPTKRFTLSTTIRLARQMLNCLKHLHDVGWTHCDVKPHNFAMGLRADSRLVKIFDFGTAIRYKDQNGCRLPEPSNHVFEGTIQYASKRVLTGHRPLPNDDLMSLAYIMIEAVKGKLPFIENTHPKIALEEKDKVDHQELSRCCFPETFESLVLKLLVDYENDAHDIFKEALQELMENRGIRENDPFDWDLTSHEMLYQPLSPTDRQMLTPQQDYQNKFSVNKQIMTESITNCKRNSSANNMDMKECENLEKTNESTTSPSLHSQLYKEKRLFRLTDTQHEIINAKKIERKPSVNRKRRPLHRSMSQPAKICPRRVKKAPNHSIYSPTMLQICFPSEDKNYPGLPRSWSCPTMSLLIRSDLRPPLRQQASFDEDIYEVDIMRNVAAKNRTNKDLIKNERRNSLPSSSLGI